MNSPLSPEAISRRAILVITNLPHRNAALELAHQLVKLRLVACVNVLAPCTSIYHWQGEIETGEEVPLLIKAWADRYPAIEKEILERHPYDVPEIVAFELEYGAPAYLTWMNETSPAPAVEA